MSGVHYESLYEWPFAIRTQCVVRRPLLDPTCLPLLSCVSYLQIAEFVFLAIGLSGKMSIDQVILPIVLPARRGTVKQRNAAYLYFVVFVGSIQDLIFGNCFRAAKSCHWIQ